MDPPPFPSSVQTQPRPRPLWPCLLTIALATIGTGLHNTVATLLFQRLAAQHLALIAVPLPSDGATPPTPPTPAPPALPGAGRDDTPAQALVAEWGTALWVTVACINTVTITFYTLKGSVWGRKALMLLGLASATLFEVVYFVIARASAERGEGSSQLEMPHLSSPPRRSILGFSPHFLVLFIAEILAAFLGSYQLVSAASFLALFDLSTSKTRARNLNYFMAAFLLGGTLAPLIVGEALSRLADAMGDRSGWDTLQLAFLASILVFASALLCTIFFLSETMQKAEAEAEAQTEAHRAEGEPATPSLSDLKASLFSPSYWATYFASTWHRLSEVLFYHPPALGSKHRLPLLKLLLILNLVAEAFATYPYVQLLIDWKFDWGARENGLFFGVLWGSKLIALILLVPWTLAATRRALARRRERKTGEEEPLLSGRRAGAAAAAGGGGGGPRDSSISIATKNDPAKSLLPWENPSPWVAMGSFLMDVSGWSLMAMGIGLAKPLLVLLGTAINSLGVGAVPSVHNYAVELLSHEEDEDADRDEGEDEDEGATQDGSQRSTPSAPSAPSLATQRRLDGWIAITSLSEGVVGVLAPLLLGGIYTSSLRTAPWAICAWTASQCLLCAGLVATL